MIRIIYTSVYLRSLKELPPDAKIEEAEREIAERPLKFPVISGTGGARKARVAIGNRGKRGGGRVIFVYVQDNADIYLLEAYAKNQQEDLSSQDKKTLRILVNKLREEGENG
jgi:mRNA-degrading endonuclease RelE of RelBE toxin-antitoxin system